MDTTETGHVISHEEWLRWQAMESNYRELLEESEERKRTLLHLQEATREARAKCEREMKEQAEHLIRLAEARTNQQQAARRNAAALLVTMQCVEKLVKCLTAANMAQARHYFPGEVYRAIQDAEEVMRAYGFPF